MLCHRLHLAACAAREMPNNYGGLASLTHGAQISDGQCPKLCRSVITYSTRQTHGSTSHLPECNDVHLFAGKPRRCVRWRHTPIVVTLHAHVWCVRCSLARQQRGCHIAAALIDQQLLWGQQADIARRVNRQHHGMAGCLANSIDKKESRKFDALPFNPHRHTDTHVRIHTYTCARTLWHARHAHPQLQPQSQTHTHTHTHTHIHTRAYTHAYIHHTTCLIVPVPHPTWLRTCARHTSSSLVSGTTSE